jgi:hypothetical protein
MKPIRKVLVAVALGALAVANAYAQTPTPGYNNRIPESILTPNTIQTRIGTLSFVDGVPTAETTQKVYDNLDFLRGVKYSSTSFPQLPSNRCGAASSKRARARATKRSSSTT